MFRDGLHGICITTLLLPGCLPAEIGLPAVGTLGEVCCSPVQQTVKDADLGCLIRTA